MRFLALAGLLAVAVFYASCDGGEGNKKSKEQTQFEDLKSVVWQLSSASLDNTDRTGDFTNLKLTISGTYTSDGGTYQYSLTGTRPTPSPWPSSGTFKFGTPPESKITRLDDDLEITYSLTDTELTMTFDCAECDYPGGRTDQVNGEWEFVFEKP